jgi:hypothetical protein
MGSPFELKNEITDPEMLRIYEKFQVHEGKFDPLNIKFLVYGESGAGKTVFASTWPDVVFLDIDKGMSSVNKNIFRFPIDYWEDLVDVSTYLAYGEHPFKTIVIDSVNEMQNLSLRSVVSRFSTVKRAYESLAGVGDYGKMLDDVDKALRFFKSIRGNLVLIAQVAPREYETDPVRPLLTGKNSPRAITQMMDVVGFLDKTESASPNPGGGKLRTMMFDGVGYVVKDRSGTLPAKVEDPSYGSLMKYWERRVSKIEQGE